jgi:hypothetical protein
MYRLFTNCMAFILLTVGTLGTHSAIAQPADDPSSDEADSTTEADAKSADTEGVEVFIPTEEISEDFAVSFPVDI